MFPLWWWRVKSTRPATTDLHFGGKRLFELRFSSRVFRELAVEVSKVARLEFLRSELNSKHCPISYPDPSSGCSASLKLYNT
jgi:hypothetical protein